MLQDARYATSGNNLESKCLNATYFCSTLNVNSEKLEKEMCKMQKSNMPSFSNPLSSGKSNQTEPRTSDVTTAPKMRACKKSLFLTVTWAWRLKTDL